MLNWEKWIKLHKFASVLPSPRYLFKQHESFRCTELATGCLVRGINPTMTFCSSLFALPWGEAQRSSWLPEPIQRSRLAKVASGQVLCRLSRCGDKVAGWDGDGDQHPGEERLQGESPFPNPQALIWWLRFGVRELMPGPGRLQERAAT